MSNKKSKTSRTGNARAPRESSSGFAEGDPGKARLSPLKLSLLVGKIVLGSALILSAVGGLAYGVYQYARTTPRFAIQTIELSGTRRLVRDDILGAAKIKPGDNLFALDVTQAERALLQSPWIAEAHVTRRLPGLVKVHVEEREPRAVVLVAGMNFLVSADGVPFKELGLGDPHDLPLITGISQLSLSKDRQAELSRISQSLHLLREYEKLGLAEEYPAQEVHLSNSGDTDLIVGANGTTLHLGQAPFKRKLLRAERVLEKTRRENGEPSVIFLDNQAHPERVVVRVQ